MKNRRLQISNITLFFFLSLNSLIAQSIINLKENDTIPLDPDVRYGKLSNGFTYYIKTTGKVRNKVAMHLVVKAGFDQEDEDQFELAHLLEHMPFVGTDNFPNAYDYFEKRGIKYGTEINASTENDHTNFYLTLPSDSDLIQSGLHFLRDCAQGILLEPDKIDNERKVVLEELRMFGGFYYPKMQSQYLGNLIGNAKFNTRASVDTRENIKNFKHESLFRFYKDWYRPDLQAVIIVGDIDADKIENRVKFLFSDLKNPSVVRKMNVAQDSTNREDQFIIVTHEDKPNISFEIYMRSEPYRIPISKGDLKILAVKQLYNEMIKSRFIEVQRQVFPPFQGAISLFEEKFSTNYSALITKIEINQDSMKNSFQSAMIELERVKLYGFSERELIKAKQKTFNIYANTHADDVHHLVSDYVQHFVAGRLAPGPESLKLIMQHLIDEISLNEVNAKIQEWVDTESMDIVILAPERKRDSLPNEATVLNWIEEIRTRQIAPYKSRIIDKSLMTHNELSELKIYGKTTRSSISRIGVIKLTLGNGVQVYLKPFEPKDRARDQVLLNVVSHGGASLYSSEDYSSASFATSILAFAGLGPFNRFELKEYLEGEGVHSCYPYITDKETGIKGTSEKYGVEIMLQLVNKYFRNLIIDKITFDQWLHSNSNYLRSLDANSQNAFLDTIQREINKPFSRVILSLDNLQKVKLERVNEIYNERFRDISDFKFVLTGDFNAEEVIPLILKYIGSIPIVDTRNVCRDKNVIKQGRKLSKILYTGMDREKSEVQLHFIGPYIYSPKNNIEIAILKRLLQDVLLDRLRNKEGGTYSVSVGVNYSKPYNESYHFTIGFSCDPKNTDALISATLEEILNLRYHIPSTKSYEKAVSLEKQAHVERMNSNIFWSVYLANQLQNSESLTDVREENFLISKLTPKMIQNAAQQYLNEESLMCFVMHPKDFKQNVVKIGTGKGGEKAFQDEIITGILNTDSPNWQSIYSQLEEKYSSMEADSAIKVAKLKFYENDTAQFENCIVDYMNSYVEKLPLGMINNYAWNIFKISDNPIALKSALEWIKYGLDNRENDTLEKTWSPYFDTYANLLYKLGNNKEAIFWQIKAVQDSVEGDRDVYQTILDKMKVGEKTWQ